MVRPEVHHHMVATHIMIHTEGHMEGGVDPRLIAVVVVAAEKDAVVMRVLLECRW